MSWVIASKPKPPTTTLLLAFIAGQPGLSDPHKVGATGSTPVPATRLFDHLLNRDPETPDELRDNRYRKSWSGSTSALGDLPSRWPAWYRGFDSRAGDLRAERRGLSLGTIAPTFDFLARIEQQPKLRAEAAWLSSV